MIRVGDGQKSSPLLNGEVVLAQVNTLEEGLCYYRTLEILLHLSTGIMLVLYMSCSLTTSADRLNSQLESSLNFSY